MNHRLSGIISIEHSIFRNWTMQSGWVTHGSLVVPIELAITSIIFVSDLQLLNKLLSVLGSGLKTKHTCSQRECKQDARL